MTRKAGFCPTCGASKCYQRWHQRAMTDYSHELVDDARLSHMTPADIDLCGECLKSFKRWLKDKEEEQEDEC